MTERHKTTEEGISPEEKRRKALVALTDLAIDGELDRQKNRVREAGVGQISYQSAREHVKELWEEAGVEIPPPPDRRISPSASSRMIIHHQMMEASE